jgi:predicted RNase H-like HicB family nuclease
MSGRYQVEIEIGRQEDGLWRVEVPGLHGCWVDAPTLAQAIAEIQEVIAMVVDYSTEQGWKLPASVKALENEPDRAVLPVLINDHRFVRAKARPSRVKPRAR